MAMTVECPSCGTSFPVDPAKIPEGGVKARCTVCSEVFRVERPVEKPEPAPEPEAQPEPEPEVATGPATAEAEEPEEWDSTVEEDPFEASLPGEEPASQADTESLAEPLETEAEEQPSPDGDWQSWAATGVEEEEEVEEEPEPTSEVGGFETGGFEGTGVEEAGSEDWSFDSDDDGAGAEESAGGGADDFFGGGGAAVEEEPQESSDEPSFEMQDEAQEEEPSFDMGGGGMEMEPPQALVEEEGDPEAVAEAEEARTGVAPPEAKPDQPVQGFSFGQRDPADKARRLARVLVSDMIMYNPERHQRALANDTLKDDFEEEIAKSWKEYVEQVGEEMAEGTDYWTDALNDILAKGDDIF